MNENNIIWTNREQFMQAGIDRILKVDVLLDIGCGIRPQKYMSPFVYICCEPFSEYVNVLKEKVDNSTDSIYVILNYDWEEVVSKFPEQSVDTIYLLDVIEHIEKEAAIKLLKITEKIARKQVVIFTPLGFVENHTMPDGKDAWGLNGASWQEHRSGWLPEDFDNSWEIIACKDFHDLNNLDEKLEEPFGALWAIKTINNSEEGNLSTAFSRLGQLNMEILSSGNNVFKTLRQENERMERLITELKLESAKFQEEKILLLQQNNNLEQEKLVFKKNQENIELENIRLRQEIVNFEEHNKRKQQQMESLEQEYSRTQQQMKSKELENSNIQQQLKILELENSEIQQQIDSKKLENLNILEHLSYLKQEKDSLLFESTTLKKRYRHFEFLRKTIRENFKK